MTPRAKKKYRIPDIGPEPVAVPGDCVGCRQWHEELFVWKPMVYGARDRMRLCQACRDLPAEELTARLEHNFTLAIVDCEPECLTAEGLTERRLIAARSKHRRQS